MSCSTTHVFGEASCAFSISDREYFWYPNGMLAEHVYDSALRSRLRHIALYTQKEHAGDIARICKELMLETARVEEEQQTRRRAIELLRPCATLPVSSLKPKP